MNSFEERLLNYLSSREGISEEEVRQHFRDDPEKDEQLLNEYLTILALTNNLRTYRQADLQDAWNKIVHQTDLAEEEDAERIIAEIEPVRPKVVTPTLGANEVVMRKGSLTKERKLGEVSSEEQTENVVADIAPKSDLGRRNRWAIAATILLAIGTTAYFALRNPYIETLALSDATVVYLPDDSKVTLEKGAAIKHLRHSRFQRSRVREVYVDGEVIFDVVSDPSRPFLVKSDLTQVQVLGTVFKFSADGDLSAAENIEGKVDYQVLDGSHSAVLNPGDKASYDGKEFLVVEFKLPEPPPPPIPPTNLVLANDLLDILSEKYPRSIEMAPYMSYNAGTIKVNLNDEVNGLLTTLAENQDVEIEYSFRNGNYRLNKLVGKNVGQRPDYDYFDFIDGKPFKK